MSHECDQCGMYCDCDGEDMHNPQPPTCVHFTPGNCDADDDSADGDDGTELLDDDGVWVDTGVPARQKGP